jgi:hypothetical protein
VRWIGSLVLALSLLFRVSASHADQVSAQSRQVLRADDYKLRLSAALGLAKTRDPRAIAALSEVLETDGDQTVRRVAALSLGDMINGRTPHRSRRRAVAALESAARTDGDAKVRRNAKRSLDRLGGTRTKINSSSGPISSSRRSRVRWGGVYLAVGRPASRINDVPRGTVTDMLTTLQRALSENAPSFSHSTNLDTLPTEDQLSSMGAQGFYIGSTIASLRVQKRGRQAEVQCSVSMRVSPWTGRDGAEKLVAGRAASASGNGRVLGAATSRGIDISKRDCVVAVIEQITERQVVPFIVKVARSGR